MINENEKEKEKDKMENTHKEEKKIDFSSVVLPVGLFAFSYS